MKTSISNRDKAIITGLFLSKFDEIGLKTLGFNGFNEAYNTFSAILDIKPASLKNYRDEFDPVFPNNRKGRRNRPMRTYCEEIYLRYRELDFSSFYTLIRSFFSKDFDVEQLVEDAEKKDYSDSIAKRLLTGKAAESYFIHNYKTISRFTNFELKDTTNMACGFDFKLTFESSFYCIEVKGLNKLSGTITLTEKEFRMAEFYKSNYCLFVVKNFIEKPEHEFFLDPLNTGLKFKKEERLITQNSYRTLL